MDRYIINTPEGTKDSLFCECQDRRKMEGAITRLFSSLGYSEIITPEIEYYDLFTASGYPLPQETLVKIIDRSGKILVMRPDCTTPIARVAATKLKNTDFPQRFYYNQTVFRSNVAHAGSNAEVVQCGIELLGAAGLKADVEVLVLAIEAIKACGINNFYIEIGHTGFFKALAKELDAPPETIELMRSYIEQKNFDALKVLLKPFADKPSFDALNKISHLFGGEEILAEAQELTNDLCASQALDYLKNIYNELLAAGHQDKIRFDLGLVQQINYYTGMVFCGYIESAGSIVLTGGRYDKLIETFGKPVPATGFAIDILAVLSCLPVSSLPKLESIIHYSFGSLAQALSYVASHAPGTCEISPCLDLAGSKKLAKKKGACRVVILDKENETEVKL